MGYKKQSRVTQRTPILRVEAKNMQSTAAVTRAQVKEAIIRAPSLVCLSWLEVVASGPDLVKPLTQ